MRVFGNGRSIPLRAIILTDRTAWLGACSPAGMKRLLGWSVVVFIVVLALVLGLANGLLATGWPMAWMNGDPAHLRISYRSAWTFWPPLALHVKDLDLSFQDPDTQVQLSAEHLDGYLSPWALRSLRLDAHGIRASGVVFKLRPRVLPEDQTVRRAFLPDIDGFPSADKVPGEVWPALITFDLSGLELTDVREVWVGEVHYRGAGAVSGGLVFEPLRSLQLADVSLNDSKGVLTRGDETLLTLSALTARVDLQRLAFEGVSALDLRKLTANVSLRGVLDSASLANFMVRSVPGLSVTGATGAVSADVDIVRGVLQPGGHFSSKAPAVTLQTRLGSLTGEGEVLLSSTETVRRLELVLHAPSVKGPDDTPWAQAERFRLVSKGPVDLAAPDAFDGVLTLTAARATDLRILNRAIPRASGVTLVKGQALVNATLSLDSSTSKGSGEVELTLSNLELASRASRVVGQVVAKAHVRSLDLNTGAMRLDGSSVELTEATVFADRGRADGFWLKLRAPQWTLEGPRTQASVVLEVQHLQPVMGMIAAQVEVPFPLRLMSEHHDVTTTADLRVEPQHVEVTDVRVHAANLDVWADLEVRNTQGVWGAALVKSPPVVAALELRGVSSEVVLADASPWFQKWRATQAAKCLIARSAQGPCAPSAR